MENHDCSHLLASLSDYIDGEARADLCAEIEQHLTECNKCRVVVDSLRKTVSLYQETDTVDLPDPVRLRLFHCLNLDEFIENRDDAAA